MRASLAWSLGHRALAPWSVPSLGVGALVGVGSYARARLWRGKDTLALWLLRTIWWLLVATLIIAQQPILGAVVAAAALADEIPLTGMPGKRDVRLDANVPLGRLGWSVTMLVMSLAVIYWD